MLDKLSKSVGDALEFPPDVAGTGPKITITGREQITVENYGAIIAFSPEEIKLDTAVGELSMCGREFVLKTILTTELYIEGTLITLSFDGGESGNG